LFLILGGRAISRSPLSMMLAARGFCNALFQANEVPFYFSLLTFFFFLQPP